MENNNWISVEERLPEKNINVKVIDQNYNNKETETRFDTYQKAFFEGEDQIHPSYWKPITP